MSFSLGSPAAQAQTAIAGDTQYQFSNAAGTFSTGFTPVFPATGDVNGQLLFGGAAAYTATDDLDSSGGAVSVNNLTFTNTALTTVAPSTATFALTLTTNSLGFGPSIFVGSGNATLTTSLAGTVGFTKNGTGTLTLATNADTFTGNVIVNAGTLAISTGQAATAGYVLNNGTVFATTQALTGTNTISVASGTANLNLATAIGGGTGLGTFNGVFAGSGNLVYSNGGTTQTTFNTAASFLNFGGTFTFGSNFSLRAVQSTGGGTLLATFATIDSANTTGAFFSRNNAQYVLGGLAGTNATATYGTASNSSTVGLIVGSANSNTSFAGSVANSIAGGTTTTLTKVGTGTLTLSGLLTNNANASNGGTLLLNYATNASNILSATSTFGFGGGTLSLLGKSTGATTQTLGNVTVNTGGGRVVLNANGGTSTTLTLGTLTSTALGGSLNFNVGAGTSVTTTSAPATTGTYGGRITYTDATGTNWATSASTAAPFALSGYTGYTPLNAAGGTDTNNSSVTDSLTLLASAVTNSLRVTDTSAGQSLNLGGAANTLTLTNGGLLFTGANPYTITNGILASGIATTPDLIVQQFGTGGLTIGATIADTGGVTTLTKAGTGTLFLTGANTYTGNTYLNNGITSIGAFTALGTPSATATLNLNTGTLQATNTFTLAGGGAAAYVLLGGGGGTFDVTGTNNLTVSSVISNQTANQFGPLIKTNTGTLTLTANNSYNGATIISGGILSTPSLTIGGSISGIGQSTSASGALVLDGGTLQYTGLGASTDRSFTITQNGGALDASGSGALTFVNTLPTAFSGSGARTLTLTGTGTGTNVLAAPIGDGSGGATSLVKSGTALWQLTSPGSSYTGSTTIQGTGSTLALVAPQSNNPISGSKVITVGVAAGTNARLDVTGLNGGTLALAAAQTLGGTGTVAGNVINSNLAILSPGSSATSVATLTISGALTLSGGSISNFEFNGAASNDIVSVGGNLSLTATDGVNLYQMGTLNKLTTPGTYTLFNFGSLTGTASTAFSVLNPATGLTYAFSSTSTQIRLTIGGTATVTSTWNVDANGNYGTAANWNNSTVPDGIGTTAIFGSAITQARTVNIEANHTTGEIDFSNANTYTLAAGGGTLTINNGSNAANIQDFNGNQIINAPLALVSALNVTVSNSTNTLTLGGAISGAGSLTKLGSGVLTLTGANSYSGGTLISNGTVKINSANSLGNAAGMATLDSSVNPVTLEVLNSFISARSFALNGTNNVIQVDGAASTYEVDGVIANTATGAGTLTKTGPGTLILGANNTYMGITTISAGTLQLGGTGANSGAGALSGNIINNGTLALAQSVDNTLTNVVSGTGALNKLGTNNVTLTAANTFTGTTAIAGGSIILSNPLALQSSTLAYNTGGGVLNFGIQTAATLGGLSGTQDLALINTDTTPAAVALTVGTNSASTAYSGALSGPGSLTKVGTGTLTLSGTNTYTGTTTINLGNLTLTGALGSTAAPANTVTTGGGIFAVNGGSLTTGALVENNNGSQVLLTNNSNVTITGNLGVGANNGASGGLVSLTSGTLTAASVTVGRTGLSNTAVPAAGSATDGLYVNGGTLNITTTLSIGTSTNTNSSANVRLDSGSITVGGTTTVAINNGGRYSTLDVNGGTFTSNDMTAGGGIVLGGASAGSNGVLLVRAGTLNTNAITFGNPNQLTGTANFNLSGGAAYIGAGGLTAVAGYTPGTNYNINLNGGILGALADWSSASPLTVGSGIATIQTSDAAGVPHTITLGGMDSTGNITGGLTYVAPATPPYTGSLVIGGGGTLVIAASSNYGGPITVNAGTVSVVNSATQAGALSSVTAITINPNGNLALNGIASTADRINDAATITLAGGRLSTNGLSEGAQGAHGLGALILNASSIIDLGTGNSVLAFDNSTATGSNMINWVGRLSVFNWSGNAAGNGVDQLFFGVDATGLRSDQLAMIQFYSGNGTGAIGAGAMILGTGEVVPLPVPEPATNALIIVLSAGALGWGQRRRAAGLIQALHSRLAA